VTKVGRAVVGLSLDDIRKKAGQKSVLRNKQKAAALKEVKARKSGTKATKAVGRNAQSAGAGQKAKVPKSVVRNNASRSGGKPNAKR